MKLVKPALVLAPMLLPTPALAHVKWFEPYDVAAAPRPLGQVMTSEALILLLLLALSVAWAGSLIEGTDLGRWILSALDRATGFMRERVEQWLRAGTAVFFSALFALGHIILTPELTTEQSWVPWLQAAIALTMFWRKTLPFGALGIVVLFADATWLYGPFHLLDYPVFLGLAGYLALSASRHQRALAIRLDVVRCALAVTLMWASIEKLAYPQWTAPLLHDHPELTMGLGGAFYMTSAAIVEFSIGFALLGTPLPRRAAALLLAVMLVAAVATFGKVDAIGHLMIVLIVIAVAVDVRPPRAIKAARVPAMKAVAFALTVMAYYGVHALSFESLHGPALAQTFASLSPARFEPVQGIGRPPAHRTSQAR
jgi:uncharacterized membrane protein YphA (DoxX/SURF4 family)